jgi:hypothetical protein
MAEQFQSTTPNSAPSTTTARLTGAEPAQTAQPQNPIGGANIHNTKVAIDDVKVAIAIHLLNGHQGTHEHQVKAPPTEGTLHGPINLPPEVTLNPNAQVPGDHPHFNLQLTANQPIIPTPPSTAPHNAPLPLSSKPEAQVAQQPYTTNTTSSEFSAPSPMTPLITPPSGSLQSGSFAGHIQNVLASMNQRNPISQAQANLIETPTDPVALLRSQRVEQNTDLQQQQRVDQLRDIQQIVAAERGPSEPIADNISQDNAPQSSTRQEQTSAVIEQLRESILDKLTDIQSRIETASTERQRIEEARSPSDMHIQGRDTLTRSDPVHHDAKPSLEIKLAERLHENQNDTRTMRDTHTSSTSATTLDRVTIRHTHSTSPLLGSRATLTAKPLSRVPQEPDKLSRLIDLLKRFSQRSVNISLLNKMDTSLEKACLTIVTGAALGYLGLEILYRASTLVALHTLASIGDEKEPEQDANLEEDQERLEQKLISDLDEFTTAELATIGEHGFVVDLAGIVVSSHSGEPLAHVEVDCSEFGRCYTDLHGRFIFGNIPLGTPYTINVSSKQLKLKPLVITGVCGELEFLTIRVQVA